MKPLFFMHLLLFCSVAARAGASDPLQYEARMTAEARTFFSSCSGPFDESACLKSQHEFATDYFEAFEGNTQDQWITGTFFAEGYPSGIKPDPVMACAWWIVTDRSGGTAPVNPSVRPFAGMCSGLPGTSDAADSIEAEMQTVKNLTY